jgi:hypothetical protein
VRPARKVGVEQFAESSRRASVAAIALGRLKIRA